MCQGITDVANKQHTADVHKNKRKATNALILLEGNEQFVPSKDFKSKMKLFQFGPHHIWIKQDWSQGVAGVVWEAVNAHSFINKDDKNII